MAEALGITSSIIGILQLTTTAVQKIGKTIVWPFEKITINEILNDIERQKSMFTYALQNDHIRLSQAIHFNLGTGLKDIQNSQKAQEHGIGEIRATQTLQENRFLDQESQQLLRWLSPSNYWDTQKDLFSKRQEGTGKWLLETAEFKNWLYGETKAIWCPGIPGAGKSVLASVVVDYLENEHAKPDVGLAFVYFNYKEVQSAKGVVASFLRQLIERRGSLTEDTRSILRSNASKQVQSSFKEYLKLSTAEIQCLSRVYIIVDALDECSEDEGNRREFVAGLKDIASDARLLITSRPVGSIEEYMSNVCRIEIRANDGDVTTYLAAQIERHDRLSRFCRDLELKKAIIEGIREKASGMFLLAQLHMDSVAREDNKRDVRRALERLPAEVNKTYADAMKRIDRQDQRAVKRARQVLTWILYAERHLRVKELQQALAIEPEDTDLDADALPDALVLVSVCAGPVVIDRERATFRLVHYTAQEYFGSAGADLFPEAQRIIASTCMTYLYFQVFGGVPNTALLDNEYPFLAYAASYWGFHVRNTPDLVSSEKLLAFLSDISKSTFVYEARYYHSPGYDSWFDERNKVPGILLAASFGLQAAIEEMLDRGIDVNSTDNSRRTALHTASEEGHSFLINTLTRRGADVNFKDSHGQTPLYVAVQHEEKNVETILSIKDVDPNIADDKGWTLLHIAVMDAQEEIVELLLNHGDIDPNVRDVRGAAPLHWSMNGEVALVKMLLDRPDGNPNITDMKGATPLHWAAECRREGLLKMLLNRDDIDPNMTDNDGTTPLHIAARHRHEGMVKLLLEHTSALNAANEVGLTPLHRAVLRGHETIVQLLFQHEEVDPNIMDPNRWTRCILQLRRHIKVSSNSSSATTEAIE